MKKERPIVNTTLSLKSSHQKFEDYLAQVEKIVSELEEGNLSLEESMDRYENGIKALKKCYEILNGMEKKIEILLKDEKGCLQHKPFGKISNND